jgi:hypothetical protein
MKTYLLSRHMYQLFPLPLQSDGRFRRHHWTSGQSLGSLSLIFRLKPCFRINFFLVKLEPRRRLVSNYWYDV